MKEVIKDYIKMHGLMGLTIVLKQCLIDLAEDEKDPYKSIYKKAAEVIGHINFQVIYNSNGKLVLTHGSIIQPLPSELDKE